LALARRLSGPADRRCGRGSDYGATKAHVGANGKTILIAVAVRGHEPMASAVHFLIKIKTIGTGAGLGRGMQKTFNIEAKLLRVCTIGAVYPVGVSLSNLC